MKEERDTNKMWAEYILWAKMMLRTVRPWQKKTEINIDGIAKSIDYIMGWNACLKEMKKNEVKWFKNMEEFIK